MTPEPDRPTLQSDIAWLAEAARAQIDGCRKRAFDGTMLFTPDGVGNYDAHWTRDFYYMTQAFDLLDPAEARAGVQYLLDGQRDDGVIPDRRQADGLSVYEAGPVGRPIGDFPLDNSAFMVLLVSDYVRYTGQIDLFQHNADRLEHAMRATPLSEEGLACNDPARPHSPYGFTDCVGKTGEELFCSLLDWQASQALSQLYARTGDARRATLFAGRAERTIAGLGRLWDAERGLFLAASVDCRQADIWGNAFCLYIGAPIPAGWRESILAYLHRHAGEITQRGQVRHLPAGETWQRLLLDTPPGTYQNGGYWGTATGWLIYALAQVDAPLAARLFHDLVVDYRQRGIHEWVNGDVTRLPNYVASATNPLAAVRRLVQEGRL